MKGEKGGRRIRNIMAKMSVVARYLLAATALSLFGGPTVSIGKPLNLLIPCMLWRLSV